MLLKIRGVLDHNASAASNARLSATIGCLNFTFLFLTNAVTAAWSNLKRELRSMLHHKYRSFTKSRRPDSAPPCGDRRGAVAVEMALTLPILFLILFGAFELGQANMIRHATDAAAYEGARVAILPGATPAEAEAAARQILDTVGVTSFTMQVTPNPILSNTQEVELTIEVPLDQNMGVARFVDGVRFTGRCRLSRELVSELGP